MEVFEKAILDCFLTVLFLKCDWTQQWRIRTAFYFFIRLKEKKFEKKVATELQPV
jgi:hypothetical protein